MIYLASLSPRRKQLLRLLVGDNFRVIASDYEEDNTLDMPAEKMVLKHSIGKAESVAAGLERGIVIAADTIGLLDGKVLTKPEGKEGARQMLGLISGREIKVISGLAVIDIEKNKTISGIEETKVLIKELTPEEIGDYVATGEPLDKAGSFAIQGKGAAIVRSVDGCFYNVMGLPLFQLGRTLKELGLNIYKMG